jgi:secretion/DNA translocation related TadE-like protein
MTGERGSGSVLAVALVGAVALLTSLSLPLYMGLAIRQGLAAAADAAALAAADVAVGIVPGYPCVIARQVAAANGAALGECELDGLIATVSASRSILGITVVSYATAGPPFGEPD